jgi:hypothetical protein
MRYKILQRNGSKWDEIAQFANAPDRDSCLGRLQADWPSHEFSTPETLDYLKARVIHVRHDYANGRTELEPEGIAVVRGEHDK